MVNIEYGLGGDETLDDTVRDHYVYAHLDGEGKAFYIGMGTGRRAWATGRSDRQVIWHTYVEEYLHGEFEVRILQDNLTAYRASVLEARLINELGDQLVNWINPRRTDNWRVYQTYHELRDANRAFVAETEALEEHNLEEAVRRYQQALKNLATYEEMLRESKRAGPLVDRIDAETPQQGMPKLIYRLVTCLVSLGREDEAREEAIQYFKTYTWDRKSGLGKKVIKSLSLDD